MWGVVSMTGSIPKIEILNGRERRRRWSTAEKLWMVERELVAWKQASWHRLASLFAHSNISVALTRSDML